MNSRKARKANAVPRFLVIMHSFVVKTIDFDEKKIYNHTDER